jgi:uncharacterized oxidoreductase
MIESGCQGALITGASTGIGRALAVRLASAGRTVIAVARDRARLESLAAAHPCVIPVVADLSLPDAPARVASQVLDACPHLDCVIHNAAVQRDRRFDDDDCDEHDILAELHTNLVAPILLTRHLLGALQRRERAWVVTLGSVLAAAPRRTAAVYSTSKAGLDSFSRAMRLQSRGTAVRFVHAILPLVDTAMTAGRGTGKISAEAAAEALLSAIARGRQEIYIGKARAVPWLQRLAPGVLARMMARS